MSKFYAQLDENKKCVGVSQLSGPVDSPYLIEVDDFDEDHIGMTYAGAVLPEQESPSEKAARLAAKASGRASRGWS